MTATDWRPTQGGPLLLPLDSREVLQQSPETQNWISRNIKWMDGRREGQC